jgi:hypothetical protein
MIMYDTTAARLKITSRTISSRIAVSFVCSLQTQLPSLKNPFIITTTTTTTTTTLVHMKDEHVHLTQTWKTHLTLKTPFER